MTDAITVTITRQDLMEMYLSDLPCGGFFIRTEDFFGLGDPIIATFHVEGLANPVTLHGHVAWHRRPRAWSSSLPSGIGLAVDEPDVPALNFLIRYGRGEIDDRRNGNAREIVEYPVRLKLKDTWISGITRNIGPTGLLIITRMDLAEGTNLPCLLYSDTASVPTECNVIIERVTPAGEHFLVGARFQRVTPHLRRLFPKAPAEETTRLQRTFASWRPDGGSAHKKTLPIHKN